MGENAILIGAGSSPLVRELYPVSFSYRISNETVYGRAKNETAVNNFIVGVGGAELKYLISKKLEINYD